MRKVLQTVVDPGNGNCMQAAIASLFDKELEEVPNFIEMKSNWYDAMAKIYTDNGYNYPTPFDIQFREYEIDWIRKILHHDGGINGYFYAVVPSQTFPDVTHAVVIDKDLNVVHDPNPNQKALELKPEDIITVYTLREDWYIDVDGTFVIEEDG